MKTSWTSQKYVPARKIWAHVVKKVGNPPELQENSYKYEDNHVSIHTSINVTVVYCCWNDTHWIIK